MAHILFRIWHGMCYMAICWLCFSDRRQTSAKACFPCFSVWFSSCLWIWISPLSLPPSKLQLSIPPSFSPRLLSFLPPAQTSSQTQRVDGKYDWILPWLQIMCKTAGKRGTARKRERQRQHIGQWKVKLMVALRISWSKSFGAESVNFVVSLCSEVNPLIFKNYWL